MPTTPSQYELTFIMGEKVHLEEGKAKSTELQDFITANEGEVTKEELWGRRELAYPIKRNRTGFYVTLWFTSATSLVRKVEEQIRFDESIIRSLITLAYTDAQPGSLYPVVEEEKAENQEKENAVNTFPPNVANAYADA